MCVSLFCEFVVVFKFCSVAVEDESVFVEVKPVPDCIILTPVAFVRFVKDIALLLSENTFLYRLESLTSTLPLGWTKYFTPLS